MIRKFPAFDSLPVHCQSAIRAYIRFYISGKDGLVEARYSALWELKQALNLEGLDVGDALAYYAE